MKKHTYRREPIQRANHRADIDWIRINQIGTKQFGRFFDNWIDLRLRALFSSRFLDRAEISLVFAQSSELLFVFEKKWLMLVHKLLLTRWWREKTSFSRMCVFFRFEWLIRPQNVHVWSVLFMSLPYFKGFFCIIDRVWSRKFSKQTNNEILEKKKMKEKNHWNRTNDQTERNLLWSKKKGKKGR